MRKTSVSITLLILLVLTLAVAGTAADTKAQVTKIILEPSSLVLSEPEKGRRVLVTGIDTDGQKTDLTHEAIIELQGNALKLGDDGLIYPVASGETKVKVSAAGHSAELSVTVADLSAARPVNFKRDVMPILNKTGCTSGPCHGAAKGKNGFKLSLRGYDPEFDYQALLYEISGRRVNRAAPAESLLFSKPTQAVPHQGGMVLTQPEYKETILRWISEGTVFGDNKKDAVEKLEIFPKEIFMARPGIKQQVLVFAHYGDGTVRDVSKEASIKSNVETIATVAPGGEHVMTAVAPGPVRMEGAQSIVGERIGEAALQVRYEGKFVTLPMTVLNPKEGFSWNNPPKYNYVDEHIDAKLEKLKIQPAPVSDDATFLRRAYLDLTGIPPTPKQARAFLEDPEKSRLKRGRLIDDLMKRKQFVDHWTLKWGDLLQSNRKYLGEKGTWAFRQWIRDAISGNRPYDELVRELVTSTGSTFQNPAANFYRVNSDPKMAMEKTTQLFLGVRMVCAQCHDHPFERWTQNQYYQLSSFFAAVGIKPGFDSDEQIVYLKREDDLIKHPKSGRYVEPEYLIASAGAPTIPDDGDRREALAQWLTSDKNPFFARAIVNRLWSYFLGRGIIEPVDDIRASNPPVNEALLAAMAKDFVDHGYDLQHVIRTIVNSRAYQAGIDMNEWNATDETNFSRFIPRRLPAETMLDAITIATGSKPEFEGVPHDFTAQELPDPFVGKGGFLDMFGRPQRESACECERRGNVSLPQAMNLVNGPTLAEAIADPEGRVSTAILAGDSDRQLIEDLYLATLSRLPTASEYDSALTYIKKGPSRASRSQDLLWALVNSNAFLFNR